MHCIYIKHFGRFKATALALFLALFPLLTQAQDAANGEKVFKANCQSCHSPGSKDKTGPGLKGVVERWGGDEAALTKWIQNPKSMIDAGHPRAVAVYNEWKGRSGMMAAQAVSPAEVKDILAYVAAYVEPADGPTGATGAVGAPVEEKKTNPLFVWLGLALLFAVLIAILAPVRRNLQNARAARDGKRVVERSFSQEISHWVNANKKPTMILGFVVFVFLFLAGWDTLMGVGVYQDYAPEQPIKFSHAIHAGQNKIDCRYCHTGAEKSKHANIPSANVCMNCHKQVQEGPQYGKEEIGKIYAALDYNPQTGEYGPNPKPIKWIRVHNLPDHAYFNHSQHTKVGKIACQTCHGEVEKMEVLKQNSPLTMGWCINCHRETEVKADSNAYYTDLKAKFMALHPDGKFTVDKIGGLECAKCHY